MVHGGICLSRIDDGPTVFVENGIPGELVEVALRFRKGRAWFAAVERVLEPSEHRREPPCPYLPACGGCQLQHVAYAHQQTLKRGVVLDALRRQHVPQPQELREHGAADPWNYRWRGEFHVVPGAGGMRDAALGFNRARSWKPIAVDDCLIHHPTIRDSLPALRTLVRSGAQAELTALHVTAGENGREVLVRGKPQRALDAAAVDAVSLAMGGTQLSTEATTLHWRGHTFRVTPEAFMQVNWDQMDVLYQCAIDALGGSDGARIVDAYAGIGVLPIHLAGDAREVVCIESNAAAARLGVLNARMNNVADRVRYLPQTAEAALPKLAASEAIDAVILDPPRSGCDSAVSGWLALAGPPRVVYISCDPATLARDLHVLVSSGPYTLRRLDIVDMFPQTYHVECVAQLLRDDAAAPGGAPG
jgi:23S rRNA (uracil1939-C5)-methyltransferase